MSAIIFFIIFFVLLNTGLKLSFWKWWQMLIMGIFFGIFIWIIYPVAIAQSQTTVNLQLADTDNRKNFTVLLTIEAFIFIYFCLTYLKQLFQSKPINKKLKFLNLFPGLLVFPVLYELFIQVVFNFSGVEFSKLALLSAIAISILIPLFSLGLKRLFPEKDFRIEILLLSSFLVVVLSLISTHSGSIIYKVEESTDFIQLFSSLGIILLFAIFGFLGNKLYWQLKNKTIQKHGRNF